ncbi:MAG TPA: ATPase P [Acidobacteria bacterium]|nr:ATPase P [Acidobacteriota bacterium]
MEKPGIHLAIPGRGALRLRRLVTDYSGTLSCAGRLSPGVGDRLVRLAERLEIAVLTSDTFGTAAEELDGLPVEVHILEDQDHDLQKHAFVHSLGPGETAAFGNGMNDRLMLAAVRAAGGLAVAVDNGEGCAFEALQAANLFIHGAEAALDPLLDPRRLAAGLRR